MSSPAAPVALPALVFDGDCGFCTTTARWAERRVGKSVTVVAWQFLDLEAHGLTIEDVTTAAYWIDPDGVVHRGHRAVAETMTAMGGLWTIPGRAIPHRPVSWIADGLYRLVARYRYRLPGGTRACRVG